MDLLLLFRIYAVNLSTFHHKQLYTYLPIFPKILYESHQPASQLMYFCQMAHVLTLSSIVGALVGQQTEESLLRSTSYPDFSIVQAVFLNFQCCPCGKCMKCLNGKLNEMKCLASVEHLNWIKLALKISGKYD